MKRKHDSNSPRPQSLQVTHNLFKKKTIEEPLSEEKTSEELMELVELAKFINIIAEILTFLIRQHKKAGTPLLVESPYYLPEPPKISITDYLQEFTRYDHLDNTAIFIQMLMILDVYALKTSQGLHERNIHRLIAGSLLLSQKFISDKAYTNKGFAQIADLKVEEVRDLERALFFDIEVEIPFYPAKCEPYKKLLLSMYQRRYGALVAEERRPFEVYEDALRPEGSCPK